MEPFEMSDGFSTFRYNDVSVKHGEDDLHCMTFDTYDRPTLDDLHTFEAWLSDWELILRCAETKVYALRAGHFTYINDEGCEVEERVYLRIEVTGILINHEEDEE